MTTPAYTLSPDIAAKFSAIGLGHVTRPYPYKMDHVLLNDADAVTPRALHPIFFGSFDWHSCVHGHWLMARCLRLFPGGPQARAVTAHFDAAFTPANVAVERAYLARSMSAGFERPYGWGWLLALAAELHRFDTADGRRWAASLRPLAEAFADRFMAYLPKATYPVRAGVHSNTAFALIHALDYARTVGDAALAALVRDKALSWHGTDKDAQAWEPDGDSFLSPTLTVAGLMADLLAPDDFAHWFDLFLPHLDQRRPAALFTPAKVSDRSDGKIAHLDGLNLSRAWCFAKALAALPCDHRARAVVNAAARDHLDAALPHVAGDYMGEHWLASFALLALEAQR